MSADADHPIYTAAYAGALETGFDPRALGTLDPFMPRRPRLLVPVDLQALVVGEHATVEHLDVSVATLERLKAVADERDRGEVERERTRGDRPERTQPALAETGSRAPGVYLHWAMPDGLTHGTVEGEGDDAELQLSPLPDRWLVARIESPVPHPVQAWIVESEKARAVPLKDWPAGEADGDTGTVLEPEKLTAEVGGDPAWAAVFDNVERRFAFHDSLADLQTKGELAYVVVGWYSRPDLDPLADIRGPGSVAPVLDALAWDQPELERRVTEWRLRQQRKLAAKLFRGDRPAGRTARTADGREVVLPTVDGVPGAGGLVVGDTPWYPEQCLFHARIEGVNPGGDGDDRKPAASKVRAGLGATSAESLAAAMSGEAGDPDRTERLQTTFLFDLMDVYGDPDGPVRRDEEAHRRAFESTPGGRPTAEWVLDGDPLAPFRGGTPPTRATPAPPQPGFDPGEGFGDGHGDGLGLGEGFGPAPGLGLIPGGNDRLLRLKAAARLHARAPGPLPPARSRGAPPRQARQVARPAPRWFQPQDPVVTVSGLNRSLRAGYDGRFDPETDRLHCRLSGDEQTRLAGFLTGEELLKEPVLNGSLPREARDLLAEAVLTDSHWAADHGRYVAARRASDPGTWIDRFVAETQLQHWHGAEDADLHALLSWSFLNGTAPSPVAVTFWQQPWVPLYLEWGLDLHRDAVERWQLGELDYEPPEALAEDLRRLEGRSLLNSSAAKSFADAVERFLAEENGREGDGIVTDATEDRLTELADNARQADHLTAGFEGIRDKLLGFTVNEEVADGDEAPEIVPTDVPELVRAGHAVVTDLRVVDAFGRVLDVPTGHIRVAEASRSSVGTDRGRVMALPPRVTAQSRLWFRFVDAMDDRRDAVVDQTGTEARSPVAGWLLPDHVDRALEVFDPAGRPAGQLRHEHLGGGVTWEGAPGHPGTVGAAPPADVLGEHPAAFARGLVERDATQREGSVRTDADSDQAESPLSALLRVIDTTLWTVDPFGRDGDEHEAALVGNPIAMVRARLSLDVRPDADDFATMDEAAKAQRLAAFRALAARAFPVRLGALTRVEDGLLGYFVGDDYTRFHPVHPHVLEKATPSGPGVGHLTAAGTTLDLDPVKLCSPYVVDDPTVDIHPGQTIPLTLLMSPGTKVHATCGIVPRKAVELPREWVASALARLSPSLRIGPVLVDPTTVRMPRPSILSDSTVWTRREEPTSWRDDPVLAATQSALLPDMSARAQEGYLRINLPTDDASG